MFQVRAHDPGRLRLALCHFRSAASDVRPWIGFFCFASNLPVAVRCACLPAPHTARMCARSRGPGSDRIGMLALQLNTCMQGKLAPINYTMLLHSELLPFEVLNASGVFGTWWLACEHPDGSLVPATIEIQAGAARMLMQDAGAVPLSGSLAGYPLKRVSGCSTTVRAGQPHLVIICSARCWAALMQTKFGGVDLFSIVKDGTERKAIAKGIEKAAKSWTTLDPIAKEVLETAQVRHVGRTPLLGRLLDSVRAANKHVLERVRKAALSHPAADKTRMSCARRSSKGSRTFIVNRPGGSIAVYASAAATTEPIAQVRHGLRP